MHCELPTASGQLVRDRLNAVAQAERIPLQADIEIIATCNYKCVHCYIAPCAHREDVMSLEAAERIFDQLAAAGCMTLLLTGGEIFTHKQFKEIYLAAKRRGFVIFLNTNGYLVGRRWADFLEEYPPALVSISLYGATPETYERVTQIPNSYQRCVRAVDMLVERGITVDLKCPALTLTLEDMQAMSAFAEARGIKFRYDPILIPQRLGRAEPVSMQLSPREIINLDKRMDPDLAQYRAWTSVRLGVREGQDTVYQCGAGKTGLAIDVHGNVATCLTSRMPVGNLLEQSFDEVWAALGGKVTRKFPVGHPCATCKFRAMCSGCPATVEQLTGLPEGYVQHYCKQTHLMAYELGYHPTGVPRTVNEGIPSNVRTPAREYLRALPVIN